MQALNTVGAGKVSERLLEASELSRTQARFLELARAEPRWRDASCFPGLDEPNPLFNTRLQPWPLFVSDDVYGRVAAQVQRLSSALETAVVQRARGTTPIEAEMRERYHPALELVARRGEGSARMLRGDLLEGREGFFCVELNVTGALGGWQLSLLEHRLRDLPFVQSAFAELAPGAQLLEPFGPAMRCFAEIAERRGGAVLLVGGAAYDDDFRAFAESALRGAAAVVLDGRTPPSIHMRAAGHLGLVDGQFSAAGVDEKIAVVVDGAYPVAETELTFALAREESVDHFVGPIANLLSDKRCLAWVTSDLEEGRLGEEQARVIAQTLPETRLVKPGRARFGGFEAPVEELLAHGKRDLVLKPGDGMGGRGVVVGDRVTDATWNAAVEAALSAGNHVMQRRVESVTRPMQGGPEGICEHTLVWGAFLLDGAPAGLSARCMPADDPLGLINVARGAAIALVFRVVE